MTSQCQQVDGGTRAGRLVEASRVVQNPCWLMIHELRDPHNQRAKNELTQAMTLRWYSNDYQDLIIAFLTTITNQDTVYYTCSVYIYIHTYIYRYTYNRYRHIAEKIPCGFSSHCWSRGIAGGRSGFLRGCPTGESHLSGHTAPRLMRFPMGSHGAPHCWTLCFHGKSHL